MYNLLSYILLVFLNIYFFFSSGTGQCSLGNLSLYRKRQGKSNKQVTNNGIVIEIPVLLLFTTLLQDAGEMVRSFVGGLELIVSLLKSEETEVTC